MQASACSLITLLAMSMCCTSTGEKPTCLTGTCPSSFMQVQVHDSDGSLEESDDNDKDEAGSGDDLNGQPLDAALKGPPPDDHLGELQKMEKIEKGLGIGPKDTVTLEIINLDADEEEIHGGPECHSVDDCFHACTSELPREVCLAEKKNFMCEKQSAGESGSCGALHWMKNKSKIHEEEIDDYFRHHPKTETLVQMQTQDDVDVGSALDASDSDNAVLITQEDHDLYEEEACDDCACFGESVQHCVKTIVKDAVRCGKSWFESVTYHGRRRWAGSVSINWKKIANSCAKWGPCHWPISFSGCWRKIKKVLINWIGKKFTLLLDCFGASCDSWTCLFNAIRNSAQCPMKLANSLISDASNAVLSTIGIPVEAVKLLAVEEAAKNEKLAKMLDLGNKSYQFGQNIYELTTDGYSDDSNWEEGEAFCLPDDMTVPVVSQSDCGFMENAEKILSELHKAPTHFKAAINSLKKCATHRYKKLPMPFMEVKQKKSWCLPKFFDLIKEQFQAGGEILKLARELKDMYYKAGEDEKKSLASLVQSPSMQASSVLNGKLILKATMSLTLTNIKPGLPLGLDLGIGVAFDLASNDVDFIVETAVLLNSATEEINLHAMLLNTGQNISEDKVSYNTKFGAVLEYKSASNTANSAFDCWQGGPSCAIGNPTVGVTVGIPIPHCAHMGCTAGLALGINNKGVAGAISLSLPADLQPAVTPTYTFTTKVPLTMRFRWSEEEGLCTNTCHWPNDNLCDDGGTSDDGGVDSHYSVCEYGTDCDDCGKRNRK